MDWSVLHALNGFLWHHDSVEDPVLAYVNAAEALFAGMLVLVIVLAHGKRYVSWRRAAVAGGLSAGLALAIGKVIASIVERARPFVAHPAAVHLFARHAPDASFPSDHATAAFAIATAIVLRKRRWGLAVLAAAVVLSVARVALGLHYPSDVLGGAVLGAAVALALWVEPARVRVNALADWTGGTVCSTEAPRGSPPLGPPGEAERTIRRAAPRIARRAAARAVMFASGRRPPPLDNTRPRQDPRRSSRQRCDAAALTEA